MDTGVSLRMSPDYRRYYEASRKTLHQLWWKNKFRRQKLGYHLLITIYSLRPHNGFRWQDVRF